MSGTPYLIITSVFIVCSITVAFIKAAGSMVVGGRIYLRGTGLSGVRLINA